MCAALWADNPLLTDSTLDELVNAAVAHPFLLRYAQLRPLAQCSSCAAQSLTRPLLRSSRRSCSVVCALLLLPRRMCVCRLDVSGCGLTDASCPSLCRLLSAQPSLTWLSLARNQLSRHGAATLFHPLALNRTLTALHLQHNQLTHQPHRSQDHGEADAQQTALASRPRLGDGRSAAAASTSLRCMHAHRSHLRLPSFAQSRSAAPPPTACCTSQSALSSALFDCFAANAGLEEVDLRCCQLCDADVCSLAAGVQSNRSRPAGSRLRRLRLSGNLLSAQVGPLLLTFLRLQASVSSISLRSTCVSFRHLHLISAECARLRVEREEREPRRLRAHIQALQRDALLFKQAVRTRAQLQAELRELQLRVEQLDSSTTTVELSHRAELRRLHAALEAEESSSLQQVELHALQVRERVASEDGHRSRVVELQAQLERERQVRRGVELQLQQLQRGVEEVVKQRPLRVEELKRELAASRSACERLQGQVLHMRREHSRIQQAVATHQPVPHLLLYTKHLRAWYEHDRRAHHTHHTAPIHTSRSQQQQPRAAPTADPQSARTAATPIQ